MSVKTPLRPAAEASAAVFLSLFYFLFFTPYGLVMRLVKGDLLCRKIEPSRPSYWVRKPELSDKHCENAF